MSVKIASFTIDSPFALGPMAGVTDRAFRQICREMGAGLTCSEMVSTQALCRQNKKSLPLLQLAENETPGVVQIFGSDVAVMEEGAAIARELSGADILDINMGCPMPKVANSGDGAGLMREPELAFRIAEAVIRGAKCPVTVKFRLGWDKASINCVEFARGMESVGVSAVAVHGRTRKQLYSGRADWDKIREVKQAVRIPVIANGDVFSAEDSRRMLAYTGADMVMIGRGSFGNPWIFAQCKALYEGKTVPDMPDIKERCLLAEQQFIRSAEHKGEKLACLEARRHYNWYLKGIPHTGYWKGEINKISTLEDVARVTKGIIRELGQGRPT